MTKTKSTKRALLMSGLALLMCFAMLVGSTFAWFTDSVTSAGNKIKAGNLDVQLLMFNGNEYADISNSINPIFGDEDSLSGENVNAATLWEPGKTQVAYLAIKNNGSLALKYTVGLNVTNVSKELYKVMKYDIVENATNEAPVTAWNRAEGKSVVEGTQAVTDGYILLQPNQTRFFALAIHMDEAAGNEYQNGQVDFDITILAAQATVEEDSFNNLYDEDSTRISDITVENADDLSEAFADAKDGDVLTLSDAIVPEATLVFDKDAEITLDLGGQTIESSLQTLIRINSGKVTIKNGTIINNTGVGLYNAANVEYRDAIHLSGDAEVEIKDVVIESVGNAIVLEDNAKITELNAKVTAYCDRKTAFDANAILLKSGNARIDLISGGEYVSTYTKEMIDSYGEGTYAYYHIYPINICAANASIGEISGGTFLGMSYGGNGSTVYVNEGKIEKISGGYFGFNKYTFRNDPDELIFINTANGASIDAITGGTFEAGYLWGASAPRFDCDFKGIVSASGSKIEITSETVTVTIKYTTFVRERILEVWNVVAQ